MTPGRSQRLMECQHWRGSFGLGGFAADFLLGLAMEDLLLGRPNFHQCLLEVNNSVHVRTKSGYVQIVLYPVSLESGVLSKGVEEEADHDPYPPGT